MGLKGTVAGPLLASFSLRFKFAQLFGLTRTMNNGAAVTQTLGNHSALMLRQSRSIRQRRGNDHHH